MEKIDPKKLGDLIRAETAKITSKQQQIQEDTGVSQSQISRIFRGRFVRISKNVKELCKYANIDLKKHKIVRIDPAGNKEIMNALLDVWDGSNKKARLIAKVIRSLKDF